MATPRPNGPPESVADVAPFAVTIGEDRQLCGSVVADTPFADPPRLDGVDGELGRVVRGAEVDGAAVGHDVVDTEGDRLARGLGGEVVIVDRPSLLAPDGPRVLEAAHEFLLLGVDADEGDPASLSIVAEFRDVLELRISSPAGVLHTRDSRLWLTRSEKPMRRSSRPTVFGLTRMPS
jgi:hypothetical protein